MPEGRFVAYYRVSTNRQGKSGLGLEAQQEAVTRYLNGGSWQIVAEFTEIESGKRNNRPKLAEALAACKHLQATLVIAKLDRLARNVHFISGLMESGVEFIATDNPNANKLMLHMLAAFAEHEREQISKRTQEALAAAKSRGVLLGINGKRLAEENKRKAREFAISLEPIITEIQTAGYHTVRSICGELNRRKIQTYGQKGIWYVSNTSKILKYITQANQ